MMPEDKLMVTQADRDISEHPCYGLFATAPTSLSHRAYVTPNEPMYCERCGTELTADKKQKPGAALSWEPRGRIDTGPSAIDAEELYNLIYAHTVVKYDPVAGIRCVGAILAAHRLAAISATGVEGLLEALKPFARVADMEEREPDGASVFVNVSRCRDARAAIAKAGGQEA